MQSGIGKERVREIKWKKEREPNGDRKEKKQLNALLSNTVTLGSTYAQNLIFEELDFMQLTLQHPDSSYL